MSYFAKVGEGGIVDYVLRADQEFVDNYDDGKPGRWIQVSYNTMGGVHYQRDEDGLQIIGPSEDQSKALRYNYPSAGWIYDQEYDAFYCPNPPQFCKAFILNKETFLWEPPIPYPGGDSGDGKTYDWSDEAYFSDTATPKTQGWILVE